MDEGRMDFILASPQYSDNIFFTLLFEISLNSMPTPQFSFSTAGLPPDAQATLWSGVLEHINASGKFTGIDGANTAASIDSYCFSTTILNFWTIHKTRYEKTRQDCIGQSNNEYGLFHVQEGHGELKQAGRTANLQSGDCVLIHFDEPYTLRSPETLSFKTLHIPAGLMKTLLPSPREATAIVFRKESVWVHALASVLSALAPAVTDHPLTTQKILFKHVCCLLSLALDPDEQFLRNSKVSMLYRFRQSLQEKYYEHNLSPGSLAKEHKISTRTLYSVFANAKSSFGRELLSIRMEHACRLLDDPRFKNKSIAEIGHAVGFLYSSHFTTCFRKTKGLTPTAYRELRYTTKK